MGAPARRPRPARVIGCLLAFSLASFCAALVVLLLGLEVPPLSTDAGPDTDRAREEFEDFLDQPVPESVHELFAGQQDMSFFARFVCEDRAVLERLAASRGLERDAAVRERPTRGPDWLPWPPHEPRDADESWSRAAGRESLWYFRAADLALYRWVVLED